MLSLLYNIILQFKQCAKGLEADLAKKAWQALSAKHGVPMAQTACQAHAEIWEKEQWGANFGDPICIGQPPGHDPKGLSSNGGLITILAWQLIKLSESIKVTHQLRSGSLKRLYRFLRQCAQAKGRQLRNAEFHTLFGRRLFWQKK